MAFGDGTSGTAGLYPIVRPQQPVSPFWMGDLDINERWELIQGDALAYFIELFCDCPLVPDITDWIFVFTVKASLDPTDPNVLLQTVWNEQHGQCAWTCLIVVPPVSAKLPPGRYAFDLKYRTPAGMVVTFRRGELDVLPTADLTLSSYTDIPPIPPFLPPAPPVALPTNQQAIAQAAQARLA